MSAPVDHTNLHRTAKYFMDAGEAETHEEAMQMLRSFGVSIVVGKAAMHSVNHQIALLTLVNAARRTFLGGVEVVLPEGDASLLVPLVASAQLRDAIERLGGNIASAAKPNWPIAVIGEVEAEWPILFPCWRLTWSGWRGGVVPIAHQAFEDETAAMPIAAAIAAAACASEIFAYHAKDHPMAGRRAAGLSLWRPDAEWLAPDPTEPRLMFLPSRLWIIGLGNLGQAFAWLLACLPYRAHAEVELVLQDFDDIALSNDSTSLLSSTGLIGQKKARAVSDWLERIGFTTFIEERRFGAWTRRASHEPGVALCGVDNALARAALDDGGFDLVVEAGLGGGPHGFKNFSLHTFPASRRAAEIWPGASKPATDVSAMPAYEALRKSGMDACGLAQLASRTVGVPFVGLIAAALVVGELLRRLHGGTGYEVLSGSAANLADVGGSATGQSVYAFGHVSSLAGPLTA